MFVVAVARYLAEKIPSLAYDPTGVTGNVFLSNLPSTPDEALMLQPYGGAAELTRQPTSLPLIQVIARGPEFDPRPPMRLLSTVYSELAGLDLVSLSDGDGSEYRVISCDAVQSESFPLGQDDSRRHERSQSFGFRVHAPTVHRPAITA